MAPNVRSTGWSVDVRVWKHKLKYVTYYSAINDILLAKHFEFIPTFSSVQFSRSVVSDSLRLHESQHPRPPCPSPTPGVHPNPCPLSGWCHPTISSSVDPFSFCPKSFPESRSFSGLFGSSHQVTKVSASVLPMLIQGWFPLELTGLISLLSKGLSRVFSNTTIRKQQFFGSQLSLWSNSHICTRLLEKP